MNINLIAQDIPLQTFIAWGEIQDKKITEFAGNYDEYLRFKDSLAA